MYRVIFKNICASSVLFPPFQFNVSVIPWRIYIVPGDRVIHIGVGHQLRLSCFVHTGPVVPAFILWYRNDRIVEYDESIDAKVTLKLHSAGNGSGVHRSDLTLNQVKKSILSGF